MKKYLLAALIMLLTACLSPSGLVPQTVEPTPATSLVPPATATPVPTLEPTLTPEPVDEELQVIQEFIVGNEKLPDLIGNSPNAELTTTGELKITKKDGSVVTISKSDLASSMYFYNGVFQIREQSAQDEGRLVNATYALDPETNEILAVSDYLPGDVYEVGTYPTVNNVDEFRDFFRKIKLFVTEAPENTYRPDPDNRAAFSTASEADLLAKENLSRLSFAYGIRPEGTVFPVSTIKDSFMLVYNVNGVPLMINFMKIASFNPGESDVSLVPTIAYFSANADNIRSRRAHEQSFSYTTVPMREFSVSTLQQDGSFEAIRQLFKDFGITMYGPNIDSVVINGEVFNAKDVLEEWKATGKVPKEMEAFFWKVFLTREG